MSDVKTQNYNSNLKTNLRSRSYNFSLSVLFFVKDFPREKLYLIFLDQLLRSATSIGANIIEARASSSRKDFINFYQIALKSANETVYWLHLLKDGKLCKEETVDQLLCEAQELSKMLGSSILTLKGKRDSF